MGYFVNQGKIKDVEVEYSKEFEKKDGGTWEEDIYMKIIVQDVEKDWDSNIEIKGSYKTDDDDIITSRGSAFKPLNALEACDVKIEFEDVDGKLVDDFKNNKVHLTKAFFPEGFKDKMLGKTIYYIKYDTKSGTKWTYDLIGKSKEALENNFLRSASQGYVRNYTGA
tara:strand:+ start:896 stop:1396 length:501 start_codon:yes stop_codon:yes gene_type:complete